MKVYCATLVVLAFVWIDSNAQSLPEVARTERDRRREVTSTRVYTNETLARAGRDLAAADVEAPPAAAIDPRAAAPAPPAAEAPARDRTEEEWRNLFDKARQELVRAERRRELAEQQLGQLQRDFLTRDDIYNRENQLQPEIRAKEEEVAEAAAAVAAANQAIADLGQELRRAGAPAGWAR